MHHAAMCGSLEFCQLLLAHKVSANTVDKDSKQPVVRLFSSFIVSNVHSHVCTTKQDLARETGNADVIALLVESEFWN